MPLDYGRSPSGDLLWVTNPFTEVVTYLTDIHRKRSGFAKEPKRLPAQDLTPLLQGCPFCPGNEHMTTPEVLRHPQQSDKWEMRAFTNLFPRIPVECTGDQNESYVLVESPQHFRAGAEQPEHLVCSSQFAPERFRQVIRLAADLTRIAFGNPTIRSVVVRKNQGRESGASQPHPHTQVIGSGRLSTPIVQERRALGEDDKLWHEIVSFAKQEGFLIADRDDCYLIFSPFGTFPHSYEVIDLRSTAHLHEIDTERLDVFADLLHRGLGTLGDLPLDYEIHADPGVPLHAHINARHYPYSNIAGTLNLPTQLLRSS